MTKTHSASCLGYICTCDSCYRCEGIIKDLRAENARYREALEFCAYKFVEDPAVQICHECEFGYDKIASVAYKALKGGE